MEILLAIFILGVVITMVFNLYINARLSNEKVEQQLQARTLAESVLNQTRAEPFSDLVPGAAYLPAVTRRAVQFTPELIVYDDEPGSKGIRVVVRWLYRNQNLEFVREGLVSDLPR